MHDIQEFRNLLDLIDNNPRRPLFIGVNFSKEALRGQRILRLILRLKEIDIDGILIEEVLLQKSGLASAASPKDKEASRQQRIQKAFKHT